MKPILRWLRYVPLAAVSFIGIWILIFSITEIKRESYIYESFWTLHGLITMAVVSGIVALGAVAGIIYLCRKRKK